MSLFVPMNSTDSSDREREGVPESPRHWHLQQTILTAAARSVQSRMKWDSYHKFLSRNYKDNETENAIRQRYTHMVNCLEGPTILMLQCFNWCHSIPPTNLNCLPKKPIYSQPHLNQVIFKEKMVLKIQGGWLKMEGQRNHWQWKFCMKGITII